MEGLRESEREGAMKSNLVRLLSVRVNGGEREEGFEIRAQWPR